MSSVDLDRASVERSIAMLDLVRAAEIARRCGVSRTTVMRWRRARPGSNRWPILSRPDITVGGVEYWSWPDLHQLDPDRFSQVSE